MAKSLRRRKESMFSTTFVVIALVATAVTAYFIGRGSVPKPEPPAPKRFGREEAETLATEVGGLTPEIGKIVKLSALVGGMEFTVVQDAKELADEQTARAARNRHKADELRAEAAGHDGVALRATARAAEVTELAANFA